MSALDSDDMPAIQEKAFWLLIVAVSLGFVAILLPFYGAVFWGTVLAVLFAPLDRRVLGAMRQRRTPAALVTLAIIVLLVILPLVLLAGLLVQEAASVYAKIQSGEVNPGRYFQQVFGALPPWVTGLLDRFGLTTIASVQDRLASGITRGLQFLGTQALNIGQNTFDFVVGFFVMLYLLFFLLRDGDVLTRRIKAASPLSGELQRKLAGRFTTVIRATVKGNLVVALLQGMLGGLIFWILGIHAAALWAVAMALLSLLPAVGAGLVWGPVAIYLLATGAIWQGIVLIAFGVIVIGLVDNILRPILVGKDTRMPDYITLISTLGGLAVFGVNGFVIGPLIAALFMSAWDVVAASKAQMRVDDAGEVRRRDDVVITAPVVAAEREPG